MSILQTEAVITVGKKIEKKLAEAKKTPGMFDFPFFLGISLQSEDFDVLDTIEKSLGEEGANDWLCDIMVASGKYTRDDEGNVSPKEGA